jgi:large subunit ribosomal protein L24
MAKKIRKGDNVVVLSGRDKGRKGAVLEVLASGHVIVESVNVAKRHTKPNPNASPPVAGGIVEKPMPLALSKVAIWNPAEKKADRIGFKTLTDGKKVRFFKSSGEMLDA